MEENHVQITELLSFFRGAIPLEQITKMIDDMERPKDLLTEEGRKKWIETFIETFTEVLPNLEVKDGLTARHAQEEYINGKMTLKECFALFLPIEKDMYTPPESYVGKELKKKRWAALSRKFPQFYKPEVQDERLSKEQG